MFEGWDSFYLLVGSAAAALIGLLFVVATLTANLDQSRASLGAKVFLTPTVFHFAVVVAVSAVALTPKIPHPVTAAMIGGCAGWGFAYTAVNALRIYRREIPDQPHWSDLWMYGVTPMAIYAALAVSAVVVWVAPEWAPYATGASLVVLLLVTIRNAWDLVTWIAPRATPH